MGPQGGWRYRGEGCACSAYGDAEDHPGRVLLVSKKSDLVEGRGALSDEEAEAARRLDAEIWTRTERPERFSAELTHIERRDWFTKQVLLPLLSHTGALAAGDLVRLRTVGFRPDGDEVGLLLPDALAVGHLCSRAGVPGVGYFGSTVAFEIKPKSAAVPGGRALIPPRQSYKRTHSEFQLMQHYKLAKGKTETASSYEPLDLLGQGSKRGALLDLFRCPQNNLGVYIGSRRAYPGVCSLEDLEVEVGLSVDGMVAALGEALEQQQGTLDLISALQGRDPHGIDGVFRIYQGLLGRPGAFDVSEDDRECRDYVEKVGALGELPRPLALRALEDYLLAATFKDCSLILAFSEVNEEVSGRRESLIELPNAGFVNAGEVGRELFYHMLLIDTDLKHVSKIPVHYEKDQSIAKILARKSGRTSTPQKSV